MFAMKNLLLGAALLASLPVAANQALQGPLMQSPGTLAVYKSPTCGCCTGWVDHAKAHGLTVDTYNSPDLSGLKQFHQIPPAMRSCHTAVSEQGYVFEGHVPAKLVEAFLLAPPAGAKGLTVPAMPVGSPGMEMGDKFMPYEVLQLNMDGSVEVFAKIDAPDQQY